MKTLLKTLLFSVVLALMLGAPDIVYAQTATTNTYLASALSAGAQYTIIALGSTTGITASTSSNQYFGYMDGEQVEVRAVNTTANTVTVRRAAKGLAVAHPANELFWYGAPASWNQATGNVGGAGVTNPVTGGSALPAVFVPITPYGQCTRTGNTYLPVINATTGDIVDCILSSSNTTGKWTVVNLRQVAYAVPYKKLKGTGCAAGNLCTTYTLLPTDHTVGYVTTTSNGTITIPALTGVIGKNYRIQIESTGSQSVTIATSSGQLINGAASIVIGGSTSFGGATIYSDGQNWFTPK